MTPRQSLWWIWACIGILVIIIFIVILTSLLHLPPKNIVWPFSLENWSYLAQMATVVAIAYAARTYSYQKNRDEVVLAVSFIKSFREEIIGGSNNFVGLLQSNNLPFITNTAKIPKITLADYRATFPQEVALQQTTLTHLHAGGIHLRNLRDAQNQLLTSMEAFAAGVNHANLTSHKALTTLRRAYLEIFEQNALQILVMAQDDKYLNETTNLYLAWRDLVKR